MTTCTVKITGWKPGFHKVALVKLLENEVGLTHDEAKDATEKLLAGEALTLSAADWANFAKLAAEAGAEAQITEAV